MAGDDQDSWLGGLGVDVSAIRQAASDAVATVVQTVQDAPSTIAQTVSDAAPAVTPVASDAASVASAAVTDIVSPGTRAAIDAVSAATGPVIDAGTSVVQAVTDGASSLVQTAGNIGSTLLQGAATVAAVVGADQASPTLDSGDSATPDQAQPGDADAGTGSDAGTGGPDPVFVDLDSPFNVLADNPIQFIDKANQFLGGGQAGHMSTDTLTVANATLDAKGRVIKSNMKVKTTTVRPHWSGGRTIGNEADVIKQAEELIHQHEERHRAIMKKNMTNAVNEMRGKSQDAADKILVKWINATDAEQDKLDKAEGMIEAIQSQGQITGVRLIPAP